MLLLPPTPSITHLKLKKIKDQKTRHFFTFHFLTFIHDQRGRRSIAGMAQALCDPLFKQVTFLVIKEIPIKCSTCKTRSGFIKKSPVKCSTCKTSQGVNLQGNLFTNFFWGKIPWIFFSKNEGNPLGKNFWRKIPVHFSQKKITFEIWPQKYPLGSTSWTPFFQKLSPPRCFWKFLGQPPNLFRTSFP